MKQSSEENFSITTKQVNIQDYKKYIPKVNTVLTIKAIVVDIFLPVKGLSMILYPINTATNSIRIEYPRSKKE